MNYLPQLAFIAMSFALANCTPGVNPTLYPNPSVPSHTPTITINRTEYIELILTTIPPTPIAVPEYVRAMILTSKPPTPTKTIPPSPTPITPKPTVQLYSDGFSGKNSFGDGYIAHILIQDAMQTDQEEIVRILITQWLEHYKTKSRQPDVKLKEYKIYEITLIDVETHKGNPALPFTAAVQYAVKPVQMPNQWGGDPRSETAPNNTWWNFTGSFAVYGNENVSTYYWLGAAPAPPGV